MRVLVACEESQRVCIAFRERGHEAYSCDLMSCSGGHPEWHIKADVVPLLNGDCVFETENLGIHSIVGPWDMIIAHPPCTYLTVTGNRWFNVEKYGFAALERWAKRDEAADFFLEIANANCDRIAIENPVGYMNTYYRKPDCIYNPCDFEGETECKRTCLWLKGLPPLKKTQDLPKELRTDNIYHAVFEGKQYSWNDPETSILRSKTPWGVARAMADQWGGENI